VQGIPPHCDPAIPNAHETAKVDNRRLWRTIAVDQHVHQPADIAAVRADHPSPKDRFGMLGRHLLYHSRHRR
jgi:hypothetical protein